MNKLMLAMWGEFKVTYRIRSASSPAGIRDCASMDSLPNNDIGSSINEFRNGLYMPSATVDIDMTWS